MASDSHTPTTHRAALSQAAAPQVTFTLRALNGIQSTIVPRCAPRDIRRHSQIRSSVRVPMRPSDGVVPGYGLGIGPYAIPTAPTTTSYINAWCQVEYYNLSSTVQVYNDIFDQSFLSTEAIQSWYYLAYPLQIRWKSGDFDNPATLTSSLSSSSISTTNTQTTSHTQTASHIQTTSPTQTTTTPSSSLSIVPTSMPSHSLTTGAIAGIAVVVSLLVLAALAALIWFFRKRARQQKLSAALTTEGFRNHTGSLLQDKETLYLENGRLDHEVEGDTVYKHELDASKRNHELDTPTRNHELDASKRVMELQ
ncbi:MAG: hypothetical protein MMC33_008430 [Icmadophila ericetorum]|nr:hypothetical protein [Icmadophila ericetorum]